ncbi:hypothetical protein GQ53DRAFT_835127 [Thozetella sp. PMI_491]|nr:hypothetical protein GQ53DRAFT_835127 [Thozetella sp. PMI_491]
MAASEEQVPVSKVLELESPELGRYVVGFPPSAGFGVVTVGGLVVAYAHKAVSDFVARTPETSAHLQVLHYAIQFFRPTLPLPQKAEFHIRVANTSRALTTVHVEASQRGKPTFVGYFTMTNFSVPGALSAKTGWQLSPRPVPPTSMQALEDDVDPEWIGYLTPYSPTIFRRGHSYIKFFVQRTISDRHFLDQWVTPAWQEPSSPNGAVWNKDTLHLAIDNTLPILHNFVDPVERPSWFEVIAQAGLAQRKARAEGKSDSFLGKGFGDHDTNINYIVSTMTISTEVKRLLPEEGTKWLFLRITVRSLLENRMDYDIVVLNQEGQLVATSQHAMMAVPVNDKRARKAAL